MGRNLERSRARRAAALRVLARKRVQKDKSFGAGTPSQSARSTDDAVFDSDKY